VEVAYRHVERSQAPASTPGPGPMTPRWSALSLVRLGTHG